tara:strand:+ start:476 stop:1108 length:633 start_codon:yes stop_codon:yes gene_type:complete
MSVNQKKILIYDYGLGNPKSVQNMLSFLNIESTISSDLNELLKSYLVIIPGVGHFGEGMTRLERNGADSVLREYVKSGNYLVGICLGMQLLFDHSEEGDSEGLGFIEGEVVKFSNLKNDLKIPNMGWRNVEILNKNFNINYPDSPRFYFTHSYYVKCKSPNDVLMNANYGFNYNVGVLKNNIIGFQFHPEKSHAFGVELFKNLLKFTNVT